MPTLVSGDQANAQSVTHEAGDIVNAQPLLQLGAVRFDGFYADPEREGNLLGAETFGYELESFALARCQLFNRASRAALELASK